MGNQNKFEKILKLKTEISNEEFRKILVNMIIDLENNYYKLKKLSIKSEELFGKRGNNKTKTKIKITKKQIEVLNVLLKEVDKSKEKRGNKKYVKKHFIYDNVIEIDFKFKTNTYELFNLLKLETNIKKRLKIANKLRDIYLDILRNTEKDDYVTKNTIKNILSYLNNILKIEKSNIKKKQNSQNTESQIIFSDNTKEKNLEKIDNSEDSIYYEILNGEGISEYTLKDIIEVFRDIIRNYDINENLLNCTDTIINRIEDEFKTNKNYIDYLYSIIDAVKIRKSSFSKNDIEFKILKDINKKLKTFKEMLSYYSKDINNRSYTFDIISKLIYDEKNYYLIKKLVEECPYMVNSSKNGKHIVSYILDLYFINYEKLLNKNMEGYINIEFLREVYYLFTKNINLCIYEELENQVNNKVYNFITRLTQDKDKKETIIGDNLENTIFIKSNKRKKKIIEETKKLSAHYYCYDRTLYELKKLNESQLVNQLNYIKNYKLDKDRKEVDLTNEENIILDNEYVTYSLNKVKEYNILKISTSDISNLIPNETSINSYIYNQMLIGGDLDKRILDKLKFKDEEISSALTFEILLDKYNKPIHLQIYKSKVKPKYFDDDCKTYIDILKIINKISIGMGCELDISDNEKIYEISRRLLNELYLELATKKDIPFTYSGIEKAKDIEPNIYSVLGSISSKLPKSEFTSIYNIIINNLGEFHYSDKPFDVQDDFELNLMGEPNYILLENQRIIKTLLLNELNLGIEQYNKRKHILDVEHQNMIVNLNGSVNYKGIEDFDYNIKKKRKKILTTNAY